MSLDEATVVARVRGRAKATELWSMLEESCQCGDELEAAGKRLSQLAADTFRLPQKPDKTNVNALSAMDSAEAKAFLNKTCQYTKYRGHKWREVPRNYIETLADFGLELQRYLRSEASQSHYQG